MTVATKSKKEKTPAIDTPKALKDGFMYLGKRFYPIRPFSEKEKKMNLHECHKAWGLADCPEFLRAELPVPQGNTRPVWNFKDFYEAAKAAGVYEYEVFRLGNQQVIPCHNYLGMVNPYCYGKGDSYNRTPEEGEAPFSQNDTNPFFGPHNQVKNPNPDFPDKLVCEYATLQEWLDNAFIEVSEDRSNLKENATGAVGKKAYVRDRRAWNIGTKNQFILTPQKEAELINNPKACKEFLTNFYRLFH